MNKKEIADYERALAKRRAALRRGVSDEALKIIKDYFEVGLPVFLFRDKEGRPLSDNPEMINLMAARRDGMLHVIKWIEQEREKASK